MKKLIAFALALVPMLGMAQSNVWEIPDQPQQQAKVVKKKEAAPKVDPKYLAGAVPEVNGEVVFTLDKDVPGMSAGSIYDKLYAVVSEIVDEGKGSGLQPQARIAAVNKAEHTIAARVKEWLVFTSNFISLDRTEFNYTLIARAKDGHVNMTMERISYAYEMNRKDASGMMEKAENWITDKHALNKKQTKLSPLSGKFRRKTIDRKDNIFQRVCQAINVKY